MMADASLLYFRILLTPYSETFCFGAWCDYVHTCKEAAPSIYAEF